MSSKNTIPTVTSEIADDLRIFVDRVRESLDQSGPNRLARVSDLKDAGVIDVDPDGNPTIPDPDGDNVIIPVLKPPTPDAPTATGAYEYIILDWIVPNYYGHGRTEIWFKNGDTLDFEGALFLASVEGRASNYSDYVGTGITRTYWIRFQNIIDVFGDYSEPSTASSAIDVEEVLDALDGQISQSQLAADLANLNDGLIESLVITVGEPGGPATGFGIANYTNESGDRVSEFAVAANFFYIVPSVDYNEPAPGPFSAPNGTVWRDSNSGVYNLRVDNAWEVIGSPFIVRATPTTIINADGEEVNVPAGVYMRDTYIQNGTITNAMIGTAAIDTAKIADATITTANIAQLDAGVIQTGELKSSGTFNNTPQGGAGWLLKMSQRELFDGDGNVYYEQEDVTFIIREALDPEPALSLIDGVFAINGLYIRSKLESYNFNQPNTFGFSFDLDEGNIEIKNGSGITVFQINEDDPSGVVRMSGAAIKDSITSFNYSDQSPGWFLGTGEDYLLPNNTSVDPAFYLRGENGRILMAVDGNTEQLAENIDNSFATLSTLAGSVNANPLMTSVSFAYRTDPQPRDWFLSGYSNSSLLGYATDTPPYSVMRIGKIGSFNNLECVSSAFPLDTSVRTYKVTIRWRASDASLGTGGLGFAVNIHTDGLGTGGTAFTRGGTRPSEYPSGLTVLRNNARSMQVVSDTNPGPEQGGSGPGVNGYYDASSSNSGPSVNTTGWYVTEMVFNGTNKAKQAASISIMNWAGLGNNAKIDIDTCVVMPHELRGGAIYDEDGDPLGDFAWIQAQIGDENDADYPITNYFDSAAITNAVIANATVRTLEIEGNAVTVPSAIDYPRSDNRPDFQNKQEVLLFGPALSIDLGQDTGAIPAVLIVSALCEFGNRQRGAEWYAGVVHIRYSKTIAGLTTAPKKIARMQINSRRGAPPSFSIQYVIQSGLKLNYWLGTTYFQMSGEVAEEDSSNPPSEWFPRKGNIAVIGAKR